MNTITGPRDLRMGSGSGIQGIAVMDNTWQMPQPWITNTVSDLVSANTLGQVTTTNAARAALSFTASDVTKT